MVSDSGDQQEPQVGHLTAAEIRFNSPAATEARLEERIRILEAALREIASDARVALAGEPSGDE